MFPSSVDRWAARLLGSVGLLAGLLVALIFVFLLMESLAALTRLGPRLVTDGSWHPAEYAAEGTFDLSAMIWGTLAVTIGATLIAVPLGLASAVFCEYYAPRALSVTYRRMLELSAGVPSVVYGLWGLVVLAPVIARWQPPGPSLLAGMVILAIMILPTIALLTATSLSSVPELQQQGAAALGLGRWATVLNVALPYAAPGAVTGIFLGIARALGETMAVVMVCGNVVDTPDSLFAPMRTLTANMALEMGYASGDHRSALFVSGLALLVLVVCLVSLAELLSRRKVDAVG